METTKNKSTPKDIFLQLFNVLTFYLSAVAFITLFINYITALFPDPLNYYFYGISAGVRWATSVLFIAVPAYILTSWFIANDLTKEPEKRELKLRKWLTYFTLFVSAVTIIVDLMIFVYNYLNGELTLQFFLKIFTVLVVACAVFGYYIWELKRSNEKTKIPKMLAIALGVLTFGSILAGFYIVGTPADQRNRRFDEQRVMDLQNLQYQIINYWTMKEKLPTNLSELNDDISGYVAPLDPDSKMPYEYKMLDKLKFELCANFVLASDDKAFGKNMSLARPYGPYDYNQESWNHKQGRHCFDRKIDPEIYKPQKESDKAVK